MYPNQLSAFSVFLLFLAIIASNPLWAQSGDSSQAVPLQLLEKMPIKEVTVFKDGHAFISHAGAMPTQPDGSVQLDYLPRPVMGTFWAKSLDENAELVSVVTGKRRVIVERTALELRELLRANIGKRMIITENVGEELMPIEYQCRIEKALHRSSGELERVNPPGSDPALPQYGNMFLANTSQGLRTVNLAHVRNIVFIDEPDTVYSSEEFRDLMKLSMKWENGRASKEANVSLTYLERGIRWIPDYRLNIREDGKVEYRLQATLINELVDLEGVDLRLVVGVPNFRFKDTVDPISLRETVAQLSQHFQQQPQTQTMNYYSNAIMSQAAAPRWQNQVDVNQAEGLDLGPELKGSGKREDLYVFDMGNVTLKKGERMKVVLASGTVPFTDSYILKIPIAPPPEARSNFNDSQQRQIAMLLHRPKVMHNIRLENTSDHPFTTAPALVMKNGEIMSQGMMTYTSRGAKVDVELTAAINVQVERSEVETGRESAKVPGDPHHNYARVNLKGEIKLSNYSDKKMSVEVERFVIGHPDTVLAGGEKEKISLFDFESFWDNNTVSSTPWWNWYSWPWWWHHVNAVGRFSWDIELDSEASQTLEYDWHYFWRH
ncbi:MAG: hypothetical protein ACLFQ6_02465 [Candidatus Sumerlaeia bacterium]